MSTANEETPQDLLDVLRREVAEEVRATIAFAHGTVRLVQEEQERLGKTAVSARTVGSRVRLTEVLTGTVVAEHERADLLAREDEVLRAEDGEYPPGATQDERAADIAVALLPQDKHFFLGEAYETHFHDVLYDEVYGAGPVAHSTMADPIIVMLGKDVDLPSDRFAEFVGQDPDDVMAARWFRAWESGEVDSPIYRDGAP